jgi:hypothetical protein
MRRIITRFVATAAVLAGLILTGAGTATAQPDPPTGGSDNNDIETRGSIIDLTEGGGSILGGNQIVAPIEIGMHKE